MTIFFVVFKSRLMVIIKKKKKKKVSKHYLVNDAMYYEWIMKKQMSICP